MSMNDVIAVNIKTNRVHILATGKTQPNAEAVAEMAVARLGVGEEYYTTAPAGKYKEGDALEESPAEAK